MLHLYSLPRLAAGMALFVGTASADPITLEQALSRANQRPLVAAAAASAEAARHDAEQAGLPAYNPEASVAIGPRFIAGERLVEFQVGLAQTFQLGGKRAARRAVADAKIAVADAEQRVAQLAAQLEAWRSFQIALVTRERVVTAREAEQLAVQVDTATSERQKAGFGTQLESNLTTVEVGRARHDLLDAEHKYDGAVADLARAIGAGATESPEPIGTLAPPPEATQSAELLLPAALVRRPEAVLARATTQVARSEVRAADSLAAPDLSLGVSYGFERDPADNAQTILGTATVSLPLINGNRGARRSARALARRADIEAKWTTTEIEREVRVALAGYQRARKAFLGFNTDVNERLHENLELARASYTSGKIDYFQFNVVRRELIASRTAYLDAFEEMVVAWSALQAALGGEGTP